MKNLSGRKAQAARNDEAVLAAAREVFIADPNAPIAAVAARAGVGISALYRRYESKEELLATLVAEGLQILNDLTAEALADDGEPWAVYAAYLRRLVDADTSSLTVNLAGTFVPTKVHDERSIMAGSLGQQLFDRVMAAGALRPDVSFVDIGILLELVASLKIVDETRRVELRQRYLTVILDGLRASGATRISGLPASWEEQAARWTRRP